MPAVVEGMTAYWLACKRPLVGGVVGRAGRQGVVAQEQLVGGAGVRGGQVDAQRVALGNGDLVEPVLAGVQRRGQRHAQVQLGHGDAEHVGRGAWCC